MLNVVNIPIVDYQRLLGAYRFNSYPRNFGNPKQLPVYSFPKLYEQIIKNNGKASCFTSHNRWAKIEYSFDKILPSEIWYEVMFFDFDSDKPENAQLDVINLTTVLNEFKLPYIIQFSGAKGFHVYVYFTPVKYKFIGDDRIELAILIRLSMNWLKKICNLRTLDPSVIAEPKKLCRLPYTYHVNRKGEVHREQCVPLTFDMISDMPINEIIEYSRYPKFIIPNVDGIHRRFETFVMDYVDVTSDEINQFRQDITPQPKGHEHIHDSELKVFLDQMDRYKPCIVSNLMSRNPDHISRVSFALYMKRMGISKEKFTRLYEQLAIEQGYIDFNATNSSETRKYQIDNLFDSPQYVSEPNCSTIKGKYGWLCLREGCRRYIKNFGGKKRKGGPIIWKR